MTDQEKMPQKVDRRDFLKGAGLLAGAAGVLAASSPALAVSDGPNSLFNAGPLTKFTIKQVDEFPHDISRLKRFPQSKNTFGRPPELMEFLAGASQSKVALEKQMAKEPGFTQLDYALYDCGWTGTRAFNFYSWEPLGVAKTKWLENLGPWEGTPEEANIVVKKAARVFGAADVGVCKVNELWFYESDSKGIPYVFTDEVDTPTHTDEAHLIPKSMQSMIVCLVPIDLQLMQFCPGALGEGAISMAYSRMAELAGTMAEFLRQIGYKALPMGNDTSLSVPAAIDAGLGEQGRHGLLVNPVLGSALRPIKILTDLPIAPDKRISFGVREFCNTCKKCARECPAGAISFDDSYNEPQCPSNNPGGGGDRWYVHVWKCYKFWQEVGTGCGICLRACPFSKPKSWLHDVVKGVTATTSAFNSFFISLDDIMGYGTWGNPDEAVRFWKTAEWDIKG
ncbi:MAG TPA: reductive dehalogenase [Clostridiales bacterium]|nr:reductive dehalogenase [Clostridiales bacterium]